MCSSDLWEKFKDKSILVTASTGRLGMYIVEALAKADVDFNLNMRIIAHARDDKKLNTVLGRTLELPNVSALIQDINDPIEVDGDGTVDYVFHTAGPASPKDFTDSPVDTLKAHLTGTMNVLDMAVNAHTSRVIYISTVEIYGENVTDKEFAEDDMGIMKHANARA